LSNESNSRRRLSIAIPASVISDTPHLREKTAKLGVVARACSLFGVDEIVLYRDDPQHNQETDIGLCTQVLRYLETPQYLRKKLFRLSPTLRYTGIVPPLQAPHHAVPSKLTDAGPGDFREGVVISRRGSDITVDVGLDRPVSARANHRVGERVTVRLTGIEQLQGYVVESINDPRPVSSQRPGYWGYTVREVSSLGKLLRDRTSDLRVGTSRYGEPIHEIMQPLSRALRESNSTVLTFGAPRMGLTEILAKEGVSPKDVFQYLVNTVPAQHTVTVRTEEALLISLAVLNVAGKVRL